MTSESKPATNTSDGSQHTTTRTNDYNASSSLPAFPDETPEHAPKTNGHNAIHTEETIKTLLVRVDLLEKALKESLPSSSLKQRNQVNETQTTLPLTIHEQYPSGLYDTFTLPESTFTLLITHEVFSIPFFTGLMACALALFCLILVFVDECDQGTEDNPMDLPAGVTVPARIAQFLGIIIGVLLEEEIPLALEIIGKGLKQDESQSYYPMSKILFSSSLRLIIGYFFLLTLFLTVIQESNVIEIFFDVLALEFVETIDDVVFGLCRRGFFGVALRDAARPPCVFLCKRSAGQRKHKLWMNRFIRLIYFVNVGVLLAWLSVLVVRQNDGDYRCRSFSVHFKDDTWEEAFVEENGVIEKRLLVYSHFNGIYVEDGKHDGKPRYVEQNKERGGPFHITHPAEIIYCQDAESWVFRHEKIRTHTNLEDANECDWLLISPQTESYDLIELSDQEDWSMWKGVVERDYQVSITCNECHGPTDCNYHGTCNNQKCACDEGFFGISCEHNSPCETLVSTKDNVTTLTLMRDPKDESAHFVEVYGRPMYYARNLSGKPYGLLRYGYPYADDANSTAYPYFDDDDFFRVNNATPSFQKLMMNYTFLLWFSGRRWYGQIFPPDLTAETFSEEEYHAFWEVSLSAVGSADNETLIISEPSTHGSPEGLEFFEMRRRNLPDSESDSYGPFGVLIPLIDREGAGFFRCAGNDEGDTSETEL